MDQELNYDCIGSSFDDYLKEENLYNKITEKITKEITRNKEVDDLVAEWHKNKNINCSLQEYLKMSDVEYKMFLIGKCLEKENKFSWEKNM